MTGKQKPSRRRLPPDKVRERVMGNWYERIPSPEETWPECTGCGVRARVLDDEHGECIRCRITRKKKVRAAGPS